MHKKQRYAMIAVCMPQKRVKVEIGSSLLNADHKLRDKCG